MRTFLIIVLVYLVATIPAYLAGHTVGLQTQHLFSQADQLLRAHTGWPHP